MLNCCLPQFCDFHNHEEVHTYQRNDNCLHDGIIFVFTEDLLEHLLALLCTHGSSPISRASSAALGPALLL